MSVTGFSHLSVQVRDIDKVLPFYRDLLGLTVSIDRQKEFSAPDREGRRVHFRRREVYLRWENRWGASYVVLGQHFDREQEGSATPLQGIGFDHVAFMVDDVRATVDRARQLGFEVITGPSENDGPANAHPGAATVRTALFWDPEGNVVQVDQWLEEGEA
ncbi:hypothetical protein F8568_005810 [Actinomadura sp. LD22]|uniref:VOC domain-containing protein n=1 Tax=Actinomadura physcomitrii TaxID=2650748 RepID=A0A6I4M6I8_9ACTN|nr:VOC family protein [Actinomadura physcomitrii]MVZ99903.1 hypothetical protein [Actinomadura physcomitrii]